MTKPPLNRDPVEDFVSGQKPAAAPQPQPDTSLETLFPAREDTVPISLRIPRSLYDAVDELRKHNKRVTMTDILVRAGRAEVDRLLAIVRARGGG